MAEEIIELRDYFKKLQKVILYQHSFALFGFALIKKNKIDDLLCCILAMLPEIYKKAMRTDDAKKLNSIIAYNVLFKDIKGKCPFDSSVYLVNNKKINSLITTILSSVQRDINYLEKKYNNSDMR